MSAQIPTMEEAKKDTVGPTVEAKKESDWASNPSPREGDASTCATTTPDSDSADVDRYRDTCPCCPAGGVCVHENPVVDPFLAKLHSVAYSPSDVNLCQTFADQTGLAAENLVCRLMMVRMVRMLHMCDYTMDDILAVLSLALVQLGAIYAKCDARMDDTERASIAVLQCFNAHCFLMDEACPLKYWRRSIYSDYCTVRVLNSASMKLLKLLRYNLSVDEETRLAKEDLLRKAAA